MRFLTFFEWESPQSCENVLRGYGFWAFISFLLTSLIKNLGGRVHFYPSHLLPLCKSLSPIVLYCCRYQVFFKTIIYCQKFSPSEFCCKVKNELYFPSNRIQKFNEKILGRLSALAISFRSSDFWSQEILRILHCNVILAGILVTTEPILLFQKILISLSRCTMLGSNIVISKRYFEAVQGCRQSSAVVFFN